VSTTAPTLFDYARFVEDLKRRIDGARLSAARAVNRELVALYWDIGQAIREQQARRGWGDAVVDRLARDLKASFPGTTGFSAASLWRMRQFHETYAAPEFLAQLVRERERDVKRTRGPQALTVVDHRQLAQAVREMVEAVPWGHHVNLLSKLDDAGQRLFYLKATARFGWSRNVLLNQLKAQASGRWPKARCTTSRWRCPSILPSRPRRRSRAATTWNSLASGARSRSASWRTT
jgi:predicted nuclease of restriction endonuclease-like (RecB) superfamily